MDRKRQLIREAWGSNWEIVKNRIDEFGWVGTENIGYGTNTYVEEKDNKVRPRSLTGLEENNGWTKINSVDDLPKFKGMYTCGQLCEDGCFIRRGTVPSTELRGLFRKGGATHFKEWKPDPMPMY